tara:strand:+ start:599 stop:1270 length:672 start_codon:yes stop_codon:yes gene_type:complete
MVNKKLIVVFLSLFFYHYSHSNVIYEKDNLIITEIDVRAYQQLYKNNYNLEINNSNSIRDLVLINNVIQHLEINNPEFIDKIDTEISMRYGQNSLKEDGTRNFLRFSRIRDEFIINYFQNKLNLNEVKNIFSQLDSLELPISIDNCLIIKEVLNLNKNEEFIESFLNNLKNNTREFEVIINKIKFKVCINETIYKNIEKLIVEYIQLKTAEEFETFVYEKTKN